MRTKYIVIDESMAVIFSDLMNHNEVAMRLGRYGEVTGAGFVVVTDDEVSVYGRSESLNMDPDKDHDIEALKRALGRI